MLGATVPKCECLCFADKSFREVHGFHRKMVHFPGNNNGTEGIFGDNEKRLLGKIKGLPLRTWKRKA